MNGVGRARRRRGVNELKITGPFHIGKNIWYLAPNGASTAVFKVRGGVVDEIGIATSS